MPAADFQSPKITQQYADLLTAIRDLCDSQAKMHDGTGALNMPTNAIRWSGTNSRFEKYNGSTWAALAATYSIAVDTANKVNSVVDDTTNSNHPILFAAAGGQYQPKASTKMSFNPSTGTLSSTKLYGTTVNGVTLDFSGTIKTTSGYFTSVAATNPGYELHRPSQVAYKLLIANDNLLSVYATGGGDNVSGGRLFWVRTDGDVGVSRCLYAQTMVLSGTAIYLTFQDTDWGTFHIHCNDGYMGFLNTSGGWSSRTHNNGDFWAAGNVSAYSDERVKTNWRDMDRSFLSSLAKVKSGVYDRTDVDMTQVGVSAQSLRNVMPEAVIEDSKGMLSVAYGNAALVACIELAKTVERQQKQIDKLIAAIESMKGDSK